MTTVQMAIDQFAKEKQELEAEIHKLQMDSISLNKQIKGLYDAIDEGRDEQARLSTKLLEAKEDFRNAREIVEKFAKDLEGSKYTVLIAQELRNRWKAGIGGSNG
jgi:uncharacterized coiled-coil DUF342 family protein